MNKVSVLGVGIIAIIGGFGMIRAGDHTVVSDPKIGMNNDHVLDAMTQLLSLTKEQQTSLKTILDEQSSQLKSAQQEYADKEKKIHAGTDLKINTILTDNQKTKYPDVIAQLQKEEEQKQTNTKKGTTGNPPNNKGPNSDADGKGRHRQHQGRGSGGLSGGGMPL